MVQSVDLNNSDPKAGRAPTVQVDVCYNLTDVDVVDEDGESIVNPDRPETGWIRYFVSNYKWETDPSGAWRVATSKSLERAPCDAVGRVGDSAPVRDPPPARSARPSATGTPRVTIPDRDKLVQGAGGRLHTPSH